MSLGTQLKHWGALRWTIAVLSSIYAIVFIAMLIIRPGSKEFYEGFFNIYEALPPIFGGVCGIVAMARGTHMRKATRIGWLLIGLGCFSFGIGQSTWTVMETFMHMEIPTPSWADAGYCASYPFLLAGMVLLLPKTRGAGRGRILLDSAIAAASLAVVSWYFMLGEIWHQAGPDVHLLGKIVAVVYPLGDIAVIFMALVAFNSLKEDPAAKRAMALLGIGTVLLSIADSVFTYMNLKGSYQTGSWNDWGWPFGWLMVGFACLTALWGTKVQEDHSAKSRVARGWVILLRAFGPYVAVAAALGITFGHDYFVNHKLALADHQEALWLVGLVLIRQIFMLVENIGLTKQVVSVNDDLERRVDERTRQITCIQELTRAVNTMLDVNQVVHEGAEHTATLMGADAVAIWMSKTPTDRKSSMGLRYESGLELEEALLESLGSKIHFAGDGSVAIIETLGNGRQASCLITRLVWHNEQIGAVAAIRWNRPFDAGEHDLIEVVGVELGSALHNALEHAAAVEAADKDPVTGLLNHRAFHQRFRAMLRFANAEMQALSLIMLDLNNFKLFNDTYGHMAGDKVLKTVARLMEQHLDKHAVYARYGGDEFVIALPGDGEVAERAAAALSEHLDNLGFTQTGDERRIPITVSVGISSHPVDAQTHHDLIAIADQNLYVAKAQEAGIVRSNQQQRQNRALRTEASFEVLDALVTAVDNKDRYTRKHSEDVTEYALWIAEELGLSQETMRIIRTSGLLHDVGKIGVPSEILRKPDRLTPEEYEIIKRHPRLGELIVGAVPGMEQIIDGVRSHHERWDGQGYPDQFAGEAIPFLGRLLAVADAFSAMTTDRPYRKGMSWDIALKQVSDNRGTQFDPDLADAFLRAVAKRRETLEPVIDVA